MGHQCLDQPLGFLEGRRQHSTDLLPENLLRFDFQNLLIRALLLAIEATLELADT
jgi:hypothetical protein